MVNDVVNCILAAAFAVGGITRLRQLWGDGYRQNYVRRLWGAVVSAAWLGLALYVYAHVLRTGG